MSATEAARIVGRATHARRTELGASQDAVAKLAGMHVTNFGKLERGIANPSLTTLVRVTAALGTTVAKLVDGITVGDIGARVYSVEEFLAAKAEHDAPSS